MNIIQQLTIPHDIGILVILQNGILERSYIIEGAHEISECIARFQKDWADYIRNVVPIVSVGVYEIDLN